MTAIGTARQIVTGSGAWRIVQVSLKLLLAPCAHERE